MTDLIGKLPDHLLIEIFVRIPVSEWVQISCVRKQWASLFAEESLWHTALIRAWPAARLGKKWPGPIPRGSSKKRFAALYASEHFVPLDDDIDELVGHAYLYLKEQLELAHVPPPGILHGTMIDQFIASGRSRDKASELASTIWLTVIDQMEESERTFKLLKRLVQEDVFLPYPYSTSYRVQWKVLDRLFTDFRDCLSRSDYLDTLANAKYKFQNIPSTWLGY